jgi:hypothetical protein
LTLVTACIAIVGDYKREVVSELRLDRNMVPIKWHKEILFRNVIRKIARKAIDLVSELLGDIVNLFANLL